MTETLVIANPAAGRGRALRVESKIVALFASHGHSAEFVHSLSSIDARETARRAATNGVKNVVALGGDGMFHYVAEGLLGTDSVAGFFPAGNGNDIAKGLGLPDDPVRAAKIFLQVAPRRVDVVRAHFSNGRTVHFVGTGGMGLDAEAAFQANTSFRNWPGALRYLAGALRMFSREPAFQLRAEIDGATWEGRCVLASVANGPSYGSGIRIAPDAKMNDGILNVVLIEEVGWLRLLHGLFILLSHRELHFEEVKRFRAKNVRLSPGRPMKVHGDGEDLGESPVEFEVLPGALWVKAP